MRRLRSLAAMTAASILLFVFSGCGGDGNNDASKSSSGNAAKAGTGAKTSAQPASANAESSESPKAAVGGKAAIDVNFVRPEHCAAIVIHPRRIAELPLVAAQLKDEMIAGKIAMLGIEPKDLEQVVILFSVGNSEPLPPLVVVHFVRDVDGMEVLTKFRTAAAPHVKAPIKEIQVAGKTCLELDKSPDGPLAYIVDKRTILLEFDKESMGKVLAASAPSGPLVERLKNADADNDVIVCVAAQGFPELDKIFDNAAKDPQAGHYVDVLKGLKGATLALNLKGESLLQLSADGKDAEAAGKIEELVKDGLKMASAGLAMIKQNIPDGMKEAFLPGIKLGDKALEGTTVSVTGTQVTAVMKRPADMDKVVGPLVDNVKKTAQTSSKKANQMNRLRQVSLACLNYESSFNKFPTNIVKDGKALLSWRVAILPFMDEDALYKQFHLDEPWDSPHNLEVAKNVPEIYQTPGQPSNGKTCIMVFTGKDAPFDGNKPIRSSDIRDGSSNTILAVEAGPDKAVPWTKPEDLTFDPKNPMDALGEVPSGGFITTFFDGHVQALPKSIDSKTLKALITPSGGEAVDLP
jgi:hypothetical protein